jgi:hypothetical protein
MPDNLDFSSGLLPYLQQDSQQNQPSPAYAEHLQQFAPLSEEDAANNRRLALRALTGAGLGGLSGFLAAGPVGAVTGAGFGGWYANHSEPEGIKFPSSAPSEPRDAGTAQYNRDLAKHLIGVGAPLGAAYFGAPGGVASYMYGSPHAALAGTAAGAVAGPFVEYQARLKRGEPGFAWQPNAGWQP